jgi:Rieske Fe-S protein
VTVTEQNPRDSRRRRLLNRLLATWAGGAMASIFYPVARYLTPPDVPEATVQSVSVGSQAALAVNSGKIVPFGSTPVLLVRTADGDLRAFGATCTHLGCTVQYRPDLNEIWCACHDGHYDMNGRNIAGPPPAPLPVFDVNLRGDEVMIVRRA